MNVDVIIDSYNDFKEMGVWASINEDGPVNGKIYSRTVKVRRKDGTIALESEFISDDDMRRELEGY